MSEWLARALDAATDFARSCKEANRELERERAAALSLAATLAAETADLIDSWRMYRAGRGDPSGWVAEFDGVCKDLEARLSDAGVCLDGVEGELFEPERHRSIQVEPYDDATTLRVRAVHRRGIVLGKRRIRSADVILGRGDGDGH
jgi:molecular chaperone GrpE (heat shock protein)